MDSTTKAAVNKSFNGSTNIDGSDAIETVVLVICALNAPLMLVSIIGNATVLAAIIKTPAIRSTSIRMICSLAVSDLLVGFIAQPFFIASILTRAHSIERLSKIAAFVLCGVSLCTMAAISVDRFLALQYPLKYHSFITTKRRVVNTLIVIIWMNNFLLTSLYVWNWPLYFIIIATGVCLFILVSTFSYIRIYQIVRRHQIQIQAQQQAVRQTFNIVRMERSAVNTFIFNIAMILCYFPVIFSLCFASIASTNLPDVWHFTDTVVYLNSSINPLLYCWRIGELRAAVFKTLRKMFCTETNQ